MSRAFPKTCEALIALGVDPATVRVEGIDLSGYYVFVLDESGRKIRRSSGAFQYQWHPWPSKDAALAVLEPFLLERASQ